MRSRQRLLYACLVALLLPWVASSQDFKASEAKIAEYKEWLDSLKAEKYSFWIRVDSSHRPHRLYVGEGFHRTDFHTKELFIEIFSSYLAGHPEKHMLVDIFDGVTGKPVGEFGWGGFRLYPNDAGPAEAPPRAK